MDRLIKTKTGQWQISKNGKNEPAPSPVGGIKKSIQPTGLVSQNIENILADISLPDLSPNLRKRLRDAISLYQKGVRGKIDTYSQLERPSDEGGVGLSPNVVDQIMVKILPNKTTAKNYPQPQVNEKLDRVKNFTNNLSEKSDIEKKAEEPKITIAEPKKVSVNQIKSTSNLTVTDVKAYPKVVGPVEELRILQLKDFRRFNSDPQKALQVVDHKLQLLKEDSYEDYVKGVNAWRQSPMYQEYVKLIETGLHEGRQISEVVASQRQRDLESLSWNEFLAIREFNSTL